MKSDINLSGRFYLGLYLSSVTLIFHMLTSNVTQFPKKSTL
jgi:hypothetical protein